jgi:signal transduction histidine kinase
MWFFVPFTDFGFNWRPDSRLNILEVPADSLAATLLQPDDKVLAVDGQPVTRTKAIYTLPLKPIYAFTVERDDQTITLDIPFLSRPGPIAISYRLPAGILSGVTWLVGIITLRFARRDNSQAVHLGYIFLLASVVVIGLQASLQHVPFAWLGAHPLIFFLAVGWFYLGYIPRSGPLTARSRVVLKLLLAIAGLLAAVAIVEATLLFPQLSSVQEITGLSIYALGLLLQTVGLLAGFAMLLWRAMRMPDSYERQQLIILLLFIGLGILPSALLSFIPRSLFDVTILPFPISITLLLLVPAGYFFVIYRKGYLGLDPVFSQTATFIILALAMLTVYGSGLTLLHRQFSFEADPVLPATLLFLPTLLLTIYSTRPINGFIQRVFYGEQVAKAHALPEFASALSTKPETATLGSIVERLCSDFKISRAVLTLADEYNQLSPVVQVRVAGQMSAINRNSFKPFFHPLVRTALQARNGLAHPMFHDLPWAEILIPLIVRGEQIGFLAMSRPGTNGFYNAEQVTFLARVADLIAVGSEAIYLFEASRKLSLKLLSAQETERKELSLLIHDGPVQTVTFVLEQLRSVAANPSANGIETATAIKEQIRRLQDVSIELREISVGLYPPVIEQGIEMVVRDLVEQYASEFDLNIELVVCIPEVGLNAPTISSAIYRVLKEALTNIVKHSQTREVCVELYLQDENLNLVVADRGVGSLLPQLSQSELIRQQHVGIVGMFEMARLVDSQLFIADNQPHGTKVTLQIPIKST